MSGMKLFDNYEEDGQLSLFSADYEDWDEDWEEAEEEEATGEDAATDEASEEATSEDPVETKKKIQKPAPVVKAGKEKEKPAPVAESIVPGGGIRIKYCATCGKLLFVKEETAGYTSECNNCGIKYFQKA